MRRAAVLLLLAPAPLGAQLKPHPGSGDPRLQSVLYDPEQVFQLQVATGYQLMVTFGADEHIDNVAVGDSTNWQVTANKRADRIFIKVGASGGDTNLTVVTDVRVYNFELVAASPSPALPFTVSFTYPPAAVAAVGGQVTGTVARYRISGARVLRPSNVSDDGRRVIVEWPKTLALPAVFFVDADGNETLVNGEMQNGRFVIEGVHPRLLFRSGRRTASATRVIKK